MTELERARAHLYQTQRALDRARAGFSGHEMHVPYEDALLAALSWVWEEQQKATTRGI